MTQTENYFVFINQAHPEKVEGVAFYEVMRRHELELKLRTIIQKVIIENQTGDLILDLCNMINFFAYTCEGFAMSAAQSHVGPFVREMLHLYPNSELDSNISDSEFEKHILDFKNQIEGFGECAGDYIGMLEYIKLKYSCTVYNNKTFILDFNKLFFELYQKL